MTHQQKIAEMGLRDLPLRFRIQLYREALQLHDENDWGCVRIVEELSAKHQVKIWNSTVSRWLTGKRNPEAKCTLFTPKPSPELSYFTGVFTGDGTITSGSWPTTKVITLATVDKDFAEMFNRAAVTILGHSKPYRMHYYAQKYWVKIHSTLLADFLQEPFSKIKRYVEEHPAEFVRGFFDAEGSIGVTLTKDRLEPMLNVVNTNPDYIHSIEDLLKKQFNIKLRTSRRELGENRRAFYTLYTYRYKLINRFDSKIGFGILRKREKLNDVLKLLEKHSARRAAVKWKELYAKAGRKWKKKNRRAKSQRFKNKNN
ncbi:hypothetical protein AKJ35_01365 [candidate division MSBL1 archaeon SCGC-AAA833F18]|uniref:DOD-type homing endonuclease domain-containing protein n=2 Tax=candidate division MSBL1 TaxID=215777 RepID=A0A133VRR6_9EURY|nr:hypothetical protein AKJ48_00425 [candidate division MSBL1 archaeon SCGC-AAA261O19]KXB09117.1 hypothetical protein AKJ35_01365 [candidate division MSBL1 archaeon SCGC-AAA833F18]